jgi:CBS domain containing-hemolysin-like protein
LVGIQLGTRPEQIRELLSRNPHTRYPIYERDLDHIIGMVHIKELLRVLRRDEPIRRTDARPLPLVPETAPLDSLLATMRRERTQMVIVLDEHGGDLRASSRFRICSKRSLEKSKKGLAARRMCIATR